MDLKAYTIKAQEAIQRAQQIAFEREHQAIDTGHLFLGILAVDEHILPHLFQKLSADLPAFRQKLDQVVGGYPVVTGGSRYLSDDADRALKNALRNRKEFGDEYVTLEVLLLGLLQNRDRISELMKDGGFTEQGLITAIKDFRKGGAARSQSAEDSYQALEKYAIHLNEQARNGKLDPVIGRDEEIRRVLQILSRRTKNNPILVGEPGVGKTAIAEGIAYRVENGDVPDDLADRELYSLDMGALIAGAKYKGNSKNGSKPW
ncbi:MAG: Clp protease N-terminal domain-containing protein [Bacteroidales bacterium]